VSITKWLNRPIIVVPVCIIIACFFTIWNKYPILYSDTSVYIASGFELETPSDRPITYGILLRIFSLNGVSFLIVPLVQALIFLYVLYQTLQMFLPGQRVYFHLIVVTLLIGTLSGFYWSLNQLLADFFTVVGFLSLICIYFKNRKPKEEIGMFIVFFLATASHVSHLFIYLSLIIIIWIAHWKFLKSLNPILFKQKTIILTGILVVSFLIMMSAISKGRRVHYTGSLAQKGILQEILHDKCPQLNLKFCPYKDSIPKSFEYFVWNPKSPLTQLGGWKDCKEELKTIVRISNSEKKYIFLQIKFTALFFLKQLFMIDIGEGNGSFDENTVLIQRIRHYTLFDKEISIASKQYGKAFLNLGGINLYYRFTTTFSIIILIIISIITWKKLSNELKVFIGLTFLLIILNSFITAFSSDVSNRIGCKLVWLSILLNYLIFFGERRLNPNLS
jgi:hypothetical protein